MTTTDVTPAPDTKRKLPPGWRWAPLRQVCDDAIETRDPRSEPHKLFRYIDITSVDNVAKRIVSTRTLLGRDAPSRARQVVLAGDVIISTTRPNLNAAALVQPDLDNQICSTGFCILRTKNDLDRDYLFASVRSKEFVENLSVLVKGALYPAVTDKQVRAQFIPLPPLDEQKRIAAILNEQMAAVERARAAAEARLEAARALPAAYLRAVFSSPEAQHWPTTRLGDLCDFQGGTQPPKSAFKHRPHPGYVRLLQIQDFKTDAYAVYVPDDSLLNKCDESDVLIGRYGASVGRILRGKAGAYNVAIVKTVPDETAVSKNFLFFMLQGEGFQSLILEVSARSAQAGFNKGNVSELEIPLPTLSEQERIAAQLSHHWSAVDRACKALEEQVAVINGLPAALLRRAFSGEL
ncbi:MAG: restriction endonuclease subunit S [Candidatus Methylomirabilia bacterium]